VKEGKESAIVVWCEPATHEYRYRIMKDYRETSAPNGTTVSVEVQNDKIRSPGFDSLHRSLANHFALRDMNGNPNRRINLMVEDGRTRRSKPITYSPPDGVLRLSQDIDIPGLGAAHIEIYEAANRIEFTAHDPSSNGGITVKTEGIALDNRLFGFDHDQEAHFFFGFVECAGIAAAIRDGNLQIIDPGRSGLDWRYQLCRSLQREVRGVLGPLVDEKRRELSTSSRTVTKSQFRQKLSDLCSLLNQLAREELEELPGPGRASADIDSLAIRPDVGYSEPGRPRAFSVYVPRTIVEDAGLRPVAAISIADVVGEVDLLEESAFLGPHPVHENLIVGQFRVVGRSDGDSASVHATLNGLGDLAEFRVRTPGQRQRGRLKKWTGGMFDRIEFDDRTPSPIQRVTIRDGVTTVFLNFGPTAQYLGPGGEGMDTEKGSLMLAELISEAFCTELARRRVEAGIVPIIAGGEIDAYASEVSKLMKKYLKAVHLALVV
jgi:hypothetical protein